jgi:ribonuclease HII
MSVQAVSAASIVAKVARDNYMAEIAQQYPQYGFERHVGYGTALHLERLRRHGASAMHRQSFKPVKLL